MRAEHRFRMGVEQVRLDLHLPRGRPVIVALQQRDVFALGGAEDLAEILLCSQVALPQLGADDSGILPAVFPHDFPRAVGRAILPDHQLERKIRLLHEDALNSLCDEFLMVVRNHENTHLRRAVGSGGIGICLTHILKRQKMLSFDFSL